MFWQSPTRSPRNGWGCKPGRERPGWAVAFKSSPSLGRAARWRLAMHDIATDGSRRIALKILPARSNLLGGRLHPITLAHPPDRLIEFEDLDYWVDGQHTWLVHLGSDREERVVWAFER